MKDLAIEYKWFGFRRMVIRQLPERWEELNARQLIAVAKLAQANIGETDYLHEFLDLPKKLVKKLSAFEIWNIGKQITFTEGFEPWYKFILKLKGLAAPRPRLEGMTFGQFMFVDTFYGDWVGFDSAQPANERDDHLNKFVGSLYFPEKEKFDTEKLELYIENSRELPEEVKIAITLNYRLLKEWLSNLYPLLFQRPAETTTEAKQPSTSGWLTIFESIVGDDIIHQEEYFDLSVHAVLRFLTKKMKENAKG